MFHTHLDNLSGRVEFSNWNLNLNVLLSVQGDALEIRTLSHFLLSH